MITFKSHSDLEKLSNNDPAFPVMEELVRLLIDDFTTPGHPYNTDDYGMGFVIPDAPWVNGRLREVLVSILDQPQQLTPSTNPEEIHNEET